MNLQKLAMTVKNIKNTASHHYGNRWSSIFIFIYHSCLRINTFNVIGIELKDYTSPLVLESEYKVIKPKNDELELLRKGMKLPREFYYDKLHNVKKCYIAMKNDEMAYIHWVYVMGDYNRFLKLSEKVAELNYNTTLPKFRGQHLMAKMMCYILEDLSKEGFARVVGVVDENNPAALKSSFLVGFKKIGSIKTFGPFNKKFKV